MVLVLAYYRCPMLCTLVLNGVAHAMREMPLVPGRIIEVVTVSFDPRETPELAAEKKKNYVALYGRAGGAEGWHFLTGKTEPIRRLTSAVGFRYVYDAGKGPVYPHQRHSRANAGGQNLALFLRHPLRPGRPAIEPCRGLGQTTSARRSMRCCCTAFTTIPHWESTPPAF